MFEVDLKLCCCIDTSRKRKKNTCMSLKTQKVKNRRIRCKYYRVISWSSYIIMAVFYFSDIMEEYMLLKNEYSSTIEYQLTCVSIIKITQNHIHLICIQILNLYNQEKIFLSDSDPFSISMVDYSLAYHMGTNLIIT